MVKGVAWTATSSDLPGIATESVIESYSILVLTLGLPSALLEMHAYHICDPFLINPSVPDADLEKR